MKNLITNPITRAAIAGAAVWLASVFMAHGQNKPDDLKQRILAQAQGVGADDHAFPRTIRSEPVWARKVVCIRRSPTATIARSRNGT